MGVRAFIYCDYCNPSGFRVIDRRVPERSLDGRRNVDGRSFIDGNESDAVAAGWTVVGDRHLCPRCVEHVKQEEAAHSEGWLDARFNVSRS